MKKFTTIKTLLVGLLACAATSAWAADALTKNLEVSGYEAVNLFDFQNLNYDGTAITKFEDLLDLGVSSQCNVGTAYGTNNWYDDRANNRGLRLQSGGGRWIQFTVDIKADDYIIINGGAASEAYEISMTGGNIATVTEASDYLCFKASAESSNLKLSVHRYNYLLQILIMRKSASTQTADYTINYKYGNEIIATDEGNEVVGNIVNVAKVKWVDNVKYILSDNQTESLTIASGTNTLDVNMRLADTYTYTVKASAGNNTAELATGSVFEGETASVPYSQYMLDGNKLYNAPAQGTGDWYSKAVVPTSNEFVETITYDNPIDNVVFYSEGENIPGVSAGTNAARASFGKMGYTANSNTYVNVAVLSAGHYTIYLRGVNGNNASRTVNFKVGETVVYTYSIEKGTNQLGNSAEFEVTGDAILSFASDGSGASGVDWFYIVSEDGSVKADASTSVIATIGSNGYSTFASAYPVEIPTDVTAYTGKVNGNYVNFTSISGTTIPANTGVLLQGTPGIITLTVVKSATELGENDFIAGTGAAPSDNTMTYFAMVKDSDPLAFGKIANGVAIPANKAYLAVPAAISIESGARLTAIFDGEATAIKTVENAKAGKAIYNLNGQRVNKAQKGLYIVNGKKTIIK